MRGEGAGELINQVSKEASCNNTHDGGRDTTVKGKGKELFGHALGLGLEQHERSDENENQAVADIGNHDAEKQEEEGGHKGVGVQPAVKRKAVHLGHHFVGLNKLVVLEQHGNVVVLRDIRKLNGDIAVLQPLLERLAAFLGDETGQEKGLLGDKQVGADFAHGQPPVQRVRHFLQTG